MSQDCSNLAELGLGHRGGGQRGHGVSRHGALGSSAQPSPPQMLQHVGWTPSLPPANPPAPLPQPLWPWKAHDTGRFHGLPCLQAPVRPGQREVLWRQAGPQCPLPGLLSCGVADWLSISTRGPISPPSSLLPLLVGAGGGNFSPAVLTLASAPRLKHIHCSALASVCSPLWNYLQITQDELRFCFLPRPT